MTRKERTDELNTCTRNYIHITK